MYLFLAAVDDDRPIETLKYHVQHCWWGIVTLVSEVTSPLNYFTQEFIDKGMVVFQHQSKCHFNSPANLDEGNKHFGSHVITQH